MTAPTDDDLRAIWRNAGGRFYGPNETGAMPERELLAFLRAFAAGQSAPSVAPVAADKIVDEYADEYEFDDGEGFHAPTEQEGALLVDFGHGLVARLQEAGLLSTGVPAAAPSGSGAELVREVEAAAASGPRWLPARLVYRWDRIRAALLAGDAAREDAERFKWLREHTVATGLSAFVHNSGERFLVEAIDRARGGK